MNKRYKLDRIVNDRWAVWYMPFESNKRGKIGVWRIIDLYTGTRPTRFAFQWKVKGKEKTQEQLNNQIIYGTIKNFYKVKDIFAGTNKVLSNNN